MVSGILVQRMYERNCLLEFASKATNGRLREDVFGMLEILAACDESLGNPEKRNSAKLVRETIAPLVQSDDFFVSFYHRAA